MKRLKYFIFALTLLSGVALTAVPAGQASAINVFPTCSGADKDTSVCKSSGDKAQSQVRIIISTLLMVLGIMSVIIIIIGGIMYTTSGGDSGRVKAAKDTVLYAVIGLIVAILSYAIVNFVIGKF